MGHAWPEYNRLYAHPFEWTWTNQKMRRWFAKQASEFLALLSSRPTSDRLAVLFRLRSSRLME